MARRGMMLVEVIAVVAIVGVLILLLIPAVLGARETSRQIHCQNNIKQLALGLLNYHHSFEAFPPGYSTSFDVAGRPVGRGWSWGVRILSFIEMTNLASSINSEFSMAAAENETTRVIMISTFVCPAEEFDREKDRVSVAVSGVKAPVALARASFVGSFGTGDPLDEKNASNGNGMFIRDRAIRIEDVLDGTSTTFLLGERTRDVGPVSWVGVIGERGPALILGSTGQDDGPNARPANPTGFSSRHPGGAHFAFGDGSVRFIKSKIGKAVYGSLATRMGGEVIPYDEE